MKEEQKSLKLILDFFPESLGGACKFHQAKGILTFTVS
jgi:hypothetical protein